MVYIILFAISLLLLNLLSLYNQSFAVTQPSVLNSAKSVLDKTFSKQADADIIVKKSHEDFPRVLCDRDVQGRYQILLNVLDRKWDQYAYQFSHEYCHILTEYEKTYGKEKYFFEWFEEAICELASIYTLKSMAKIWAVSPPYPQWKDYAVCLYNYQNGQIKQHGIVPNFKEWFSNRFDILKNDFKPGAVECARKRSLIVARNMLHLIDNPTFWKCIARYNDRKELCPADLHSLLDSWGAALPSEAKEVIETIRRLFYQLDESASS
jgi:hypothetical protein